MLISIYGSTELFATEYQGRRSLIAGMLATRLLSISDFDTDRDIQNVELLKLKFGENSLQSSEIMIKVVSFNCAGHGRFSSLLHSLQWESSGGGRRTTLYCNYHLPFVLANSS